MSYSPSQDLAVDLPGQPDTTDMIDRLVQERCNSSALALELHLSCTNPSIYDVHMAVVHGEVCCKKFVSEERPCVSQK